MHRLIRRTERLTGRTAYLLRRAGTELGFGLLPGKGVRKDAFSSSRLGAQRTQRLHDGRPPLWLSDNPFFVKEIRRKARGFSPFPAMLGVLLLLSAVTLGMLTLLHAFNRQLSHAAAWFGMRPAELILSTVALVHWMATTLMQNSVQMRVTRDQSRTRMLQQMLETPMRRPEMFAALSIAEALEGHLVTLSTVPLYVLLAVLHAADWASLIGIYVLFAMRDFAVFPAYPIPPTGIGQTGLSMLTAGIAARQRGAMGIGARLQAMTFFPLLALFEFSTIPGLAAGHWIVHLLTPLHLVTVFSKLAFILSFPYSFVRICLSPLPFYAGFLEPAVYIFGIMLLTKVLRIFDAGAVLTRIGSGDFGEYTVDTETKFIGKITVFAVAYCVAGYVWRPWVLRGDASELFAPGLTGTEWSVGGSLLLLGAIIPPTAMIRALSVQTVTGSGTPRPFGKILRRLARRTARVITPILVFAGVVCVSGMAFPTPRALLTVADRIAAASATSAIFGLGYRFLADVSRSRGIGGPQNPLKRRTFPGNVAVCSTIVAGALLLTGFQPLCDLAAACPVFAWLQVFPRIAEPFAAWRILMQAQPLDIGELPSYTLCNAGPAVAGMVFWIAGLAIVRFAPAKDMVASEAEKPKRRTPASIPAWIARRTDNPVFLRDLTRSLPTSWARYVAGTGTVALVILALLTTVLYSTRSRMAVPFANVLPALLTDSGPISALVIALMQTFAGLLSTVTACTVALQEERRSGSLGALLTTPLTDAEVLFGRIAGRATGPLCLIASLGLCTIPLNLLAVPALGMHWAFLLAVEEQTLSAAFFILGTGFGLLTGTFLLRGRGAQDHPMLLIWPAFIVAVPAFFISAIARFFQLPIPVLISDAFAPIAATFATCALIAAACIAIGYRLFAALRRGDIAYGDQPGR